MNLPNLSQAYAFGRHIVTFSAGAITFAAMTNVVTSDQASTLTAAISQIAHGIGEITAGIAPIVAIVSGLYAARMQSPSVQVASAAAAVATGQTIVTTPAIANGVFKDAPNVISKPAA